MNLGALLTADARRWPDRTAIACDDRMLTFWELDLASNRVAHALLANGLRSGDRVAVCLPNSVDLVASVCGILKAGGIVVPVSIHLTPAETAVIFEDAQPAAAVFGPEQRRLLPAGSGQPAIRIATHDPQAGELGLGAILADGDSAPVPPLPAEAEDAVIGYTSGTTGRPKGAISTHANLVVGQGLMTAREWGLRGDDVILVTTPMAHRIGIARISNAICLGATLVTMTRFNAAQALATIEAYGVTVVSVVPTVARMLIAELERRPEAGRSLRVMVATGEAFPEDVQQRLRALLPQLRIFGFYSQTEAGFVSSLTPEDKVTHPDSVGRAVPGVEIRIVDEALRDRPVGSPGEILVRCGRPGQFSVMRGYFNRPEATAEVFADGWLRTGDIGRLDAEGFLYFVDRAKDMIVSGGYNIYSAEVEMALGKHPAVAVSAVVGVPDAEFGESVFAFVQLRPGAGASETELVEHCRSLIASYKKPKYVRFVSDLPRGGTGKILKRQLRDDAAVAIRGAAVAAAPSQGR